MGATTRVAPMFPSHARGCPPGQRGSKRNAQSGSRFCCVAVTAEARGCAKGQCASVTAVMHMPLGLSGVMAGLSRFCRSSGRAFQIFRDHPCVLSSHLFRRLRRFSSRSAVRVPRSRLRQKVSADTSRAVPLTIDSRCPVRSDASLGRGAAKGRDQSVLSHGSAGCGLAVPHHRLPASSGIEVLIPFELTQRAQRAQLGSPTRSVGGLDRHRRSHRRT